MTAPLLPYTRVYRGTQPVPGLIKGVEVWPPPAGEPAAFEPDDLSGLAIWLDASQLGLADGAAVDPWPNLANASVPGAMLGTPAPKVRTNAKNGLPVVRFTANEGRVRIASGTGFDDDWTLAYVAHMVGPTYGRVLNGIYSPNNILWGWWNGYQDVAYDNGFMTPNMQTAWTTDWKLYSADGTTGLSRLFGDGASLGTTTTSQGFGGTLAISGYDPSTAAETCDCEVAEVCIYNRKLSDADRAVVEDYLREKWMA